MCRAPEGCAAFIHPSEKGERGGGRGGGGVSRGRVTGSQRLHLSSDWVVCN